MEPQEVLTECLYLGKHPEVFPAGQASSPPKMQADEGMFPWISQTGKQAGWGTVTLKPEPCPLKTFPPSSPWS